MTDAGNGLVVASLGAGGAWRSLGATHPGHGFVELNGLPPFEPAWRGDPAAVRRYRGWMADDAYAFLTIDVAAASHAVETEAAAGRPEIVQRHRIAGARRLALRFRGRLDAHPLAEITDTDPPAPTGARTHVTAAGPRLTVNAPALPARAAIDVALTGAETPGWELEADGARLVADVRGETAELVIRCSLPASPPRLHVPAELRPGLERLAARALAYVLGCTALRVAPGELCLITDHRILPLSWTRDAYWQARLLLAHGHADLVAGHLRWLWGRCERPHALWSRSHHTNGATKDRGLQADQQLYPVLELADYARVTGRLPEPPPGAGWPERVAELWAALPVGEHGLLRSDENPADDPSEHPYPLSAQILHWQAAGGLAALGLEADPGAIRERVARHFTVDGQWAYEIDGHGSYRRYQDANDLPTAFAPLLGFCASDDPVWAATMRFALGDGNPAFQAGPYGGLGSAHTPGTWTLGDLQEWVAASLLGEPARAEAALRRLLDVAGPDGLLPEAYDPQTGGAPVRRWFAWPGAALGTLLAEHA